MELLARHGRRVTITPPGELLLRRGRELLAHADAVADDVHAHAASSPSRLRVGVSPTARYGVGPRLLAACAVHASAVMLYTSEDTTGALLRDVAASRLDLAVTFCAPQPPPPGVTLSPLVAEPAVVHLPDSHPLASRSEIALVDLADETILVASSHDSGGFTDRVLAADVSSAAATRSARAVVNLQEFSFAATTTSPSKASSRDRPDQNRVCSGRHGRRPAAMQPRRRRVSALA